MDFDRSLNVTFDGSPAGVVSTVTWSRHDFTHHLLAVEKPDETEAVLVCQGERIDLLEP